MSKSMKKIQQIVPKETEVKDIKRKIITQHATKLFIDYCKEQFEKQSNIIVSNDKVIIKHKKLNIICSIINNNVINISIYQNVKKMSDSLDKITPDISINFNLKNSQIKDNIIQLVNNIATKAIPFDILTNELVKYSVKKILI